MPIALPGWEALGFGFVEIGTITAAAQPGNPRPRLFRYPRQSALVNRMGFNNDGASAVSARLDGLRNAGKWPKIPVGINLGKSKTTPLDQAPDDYLHSFRMLSRFGDYFVINVSSPNTPGLRDLQKSSRLREIIRVLRAEDLGKPLLVKIAPDLPDEQTTEIAALCESEGVAGLHRNKYHPRSLGALRRTRRTGRSERRTAPATGQQGSPNRRRRRIAPGHWVRWRHGCRLGKGEV